MNQGVSIAGFKEPTKYLINRSFIIPPNNDTSGVNVIKGPNIKEVSVKEPLEDLIEAEVLLKLGDNITTDDIMPAGSAVLPFAPTSRQSPSSFSPISTPHSANVQQMAKASGGGIIVGGENYGQGSSREHAAIAPMFLGVQAVIAKSFARIHRSNLINFGILPLLFKNPDDAGKIEQGDRLIMKDLKNTVTGDQSYRVYNTDAKIIPLKSVRS